MIDTRLALMCGIDIPIEECQLIIHQPSIKEISFIGEDKFFLGAQCLTINKSMFSEEDKSVLDNITNFQVFMTIMSAEDAKEKKEATMNVLSLLFPKYKILRTPRALIFQMDDQNILVDDTNFDVFQSVLKLVFCTKDSPMDTTSFNPANQKAKEIADKIMRGRQIVAAQKGEINNSIFTQYISVLSIGLQMSIESLIELTMFQLYDLIQRYSLFMSWDLDIRVRLAGGSPDEHPDNWMKNIH